jgi:hypothetical protein
MAGGRMHRDFNDAIKEEITQPGKEGQEGGQTSSLQNRPCQCEAPASSSCTHIKMPENCTWDDFKAAVALFEEFDTESLDITLALDVKRKFMSLDDMNKGMFLQLVVAKGVNLILLAMEVGVDFIQLANYRNPVWPSLMKGLFSSLSFLTLVDRLSISVLLCH